MRPSVPALAQEEHQRPLEVLECDVEEVAVVRERERVLLEHVPHDEPLGQLREEDDEVLAELCHTPWEWLLLLGATRVLRHLLQVHTQPPLPAEARGDVRPRQEL